MPMPPVEPMPPLPPRASRRAPLLEEHEASYFAASASTVSFSSIRMPASVGRGGHSSLPMTVSISMPTVQCASLGWRSGVSGSMV